MKLKQKPEDFVVTESYRYSEVARGEFRLYMMDKQKLSTFDAIDRIASDFDLPRSVFSYCGLKDKQGRTRQLIAVRGYDVEMQEEDLRLEYLGRTDRPLSAENITSNRFGVTVRGLSQEELGRLPEAVAEVNGAGIINYFDSQRFGSLKHGQGFIAKDLMRGDFEAALKNYLALPSELDRSNDAKVKAWWRDHWGEWRRRCTIPGAERYEKLVAVLRHDPRAFAKAFLQIDSKRRAMLLFTYQSYLWNEMVRRFLIARFPGESLVAVDYQMGKLLFPRMPVAVKSFPLLGPESRALIEKKDQDGELSKAIDWVLGREKLTLEKLCVPGVPELFFRHEERPLVIKPGRLMVGKAHEDELNPGRMKVYVAFTLPPGAYATLVVRRLFSFSAQENRAHTLLEPKERVEAEPMVEGAADGELPRARGEKRPRPEQPSRREKQAKDTVATEPGFHARKHQERARREAARAATSAKRRAPKK